MSNPKACNHNFVMLKSDSDLVRFACAACMLDGLNAIFECSLCQLKLCGQCFDLL